MSVIAGVFGALRPHRYSQREFTDHLVQHSAVIAMALNEADDNENSMRSMKVRECSYMTYVE